MYLRVVSHSLRPEEISGRLGVEPLGRLVDAGEAAVFLEIVQEIRDLDDPQQKGIFLGAGLMAWLGAARASLEIDQYVHHECGSPS